MAKSKQCSAANRHAATHKVRRRQQTTFFTPTTIKVQAEIPLALGISQR